MTKPDVRELNRGYGAAEYHRQRSKWSRQDRTDEPSYYDISMLKPPVWKWEIASYFFFGGVSAGAYLLSRVAARFGGRRMRDVKTVGAVVAAASALPCAPLLIKDLGDMSRFHHMLRVFKPKSPMNVGTWTLTTHSAASVIAVVHDVLGNDALDLASRSRIAAALRRGRPAMVAVMDGAGVPAAMVMIGYTGVLISCTATPVWSRQSWLAPLFAASGMSSAAAAIQLGLACLKKDDTQLPSERALENIETISRVVEAGALAGYLQTAGERARPLTRGKMAHHTLIAAGALVVPELIHRVLPGQPSRWKTFLAAGVTLAGAMSLRWGIVYAGQESANDPEAARRASRASDEALESRATKYLGESAEPAEFLPSAASVMPEGNAQ